MNNKVIDFPTLAKIIDYYDKIWLEEDEDCPDYRKIRIYERAIDRRLKKINADEQMEQDIWDTHCVLDRTYEAQCDRLRKRGYTIINSIRKD